jgi:hypothetical protein
MSSYETLLENYNLEEKYANDSFSNMMTCFESLNAFANENVNFEVVISLEEAESGKIKDNVTKIKEAAKRTAKAIEKKVSEFITKIKDALSRFVAKAKITIANKGNAALKKMLGNSELVIGKDIKLKYFKDGKSNAAIYKQTIIDVIDDIYKISIYNEDIDKAKSIADTLAEDVSKSNIVEDTVLKADENIKVKDAFAKGDLKKASKLIITLENDMETLTEKYKEYEKNILD